MTKLADVLALGAKAERRESSSLSLGTNCSLQQCYIQQANQMRLERAAEPQAAAKASGGRARFAKAK